METWTVTWMQAGEGLMESVTRKRGAYAQTTNSFLRVTAIISEPALRTWCVEPDLGKLPPKRDRGPGPRGWF